MQALNRRVASAEEQHSHTGSSVLRYGAELGLSPLTPGADDGFDILTGLGPFGVKGRPGTYCQTLRYPALICTSAG